jgi:branched-subunit amino acid aminotransferase/4-amino-4-deoxychorismate lyase
MPSPSALRNAVQQAARRQRLNRSDTQEWLDAVRNVRSANQSPATVVLRSVMWRIEGKGFSKELRIDLPQ